MAPLTPEEIDVFKIPHSRMKELVYKYCDMVQTTNFSDVYHLNNLLENLIRTFHEFIAHEQIENKYIMRKLKNKLRSLSIQNTAVCNCHKDNQLTDMLSLIEDGYKCTKKSDTDRKNFGIKLRNALEEFTKTFIPHMAEEEEVFQPLLMEHFTFEELKQIKCVVLEQHFKVETEEEKFVHDSQSGKQEGKVQPDLKIEEDQSSRLDINSMPDEILLKMFSYLNPKDVSHISQVSKRWNALAYDPTLWKELYPVSWANGDWDSTNGVYDEESQDVEKKLEDKMFDEDADIDESDEWDAESMEIQRQSRMLTSMCKHLLPRVGSSIQKCDLAYSKGITNGTLYKILSLCPNIEYLDLTQTRVSDLGFKSMEKEGCGKKLRHLDLSGCLYITDLTLQRVSTAIGKNCPHEEKTEDKSNNETCEEAIELDLVCIEVEKEADNECGSKTEIKENLENEENAEHREKVEKYASTCQMQEETIGNNDFQRFCRLQGDNSAVYDQCTGNDKVSYCRYSGQERTDQNSQPKEETGSCCNERESHKTCYIDCDKKTDCDKCGRSGSHSARAGSHGKRPGSHGNHTGCHGERLERSCHRFCESRQRFVDTKDNPDASYKKNESETVNRAIDKQSCIACKSNASSGDESRAHDQNGTEPPCWNDDNRNKKPDVAVLDAGVNNQTKKPDEDVPDSCSENQIKKPDSDVENYPVGVEHPPLHIEKDTPTDIDKAFVAANESPDTNENEQKINTVVVDENLNQVAKDLSDIGKQKGPLEDIKKETPNEIDKTLVSIVEISDSFNGNEDEKIHSQVDMHNKINIEGPVITPVAQTELNDLMIELQDGGVNLDLSIKIQGEGNETFTDYKSDTVPYKTFTHVDRVHEERERRLEYLSLSGCYKITDAGIEYLTENGGLPYLRYLDLSGCQHLSGQAVADLVDTATMLDPSNLFYCDNILDGPYPEDASGCQNLQCSSRMCCRGAE